MEILEQSKYIKNTSVVNTETKIGYLFMFSLFVLPQYFGLPTPGFDLTILRIMQLTVCLLFISKIEYVREFCGIITSYKQTKFLALYMFVLTYTAVLRVNVNSFLNSFLEFLSLFIMIYFIKNYLGVDRFIKLIRVFSYLLCFLGLVEYVMGRTPFSYLETIRGLYTGAFYRSGSYRIMGPCNHSLAYGLLLITVAPLACVHLEKRKLDIFANPLLLALVAVNVLLNGSRSTLGVLVLELFIIFLFSERYYKKKALLILSVLLVLVAGFLVVGYKTSIAKYILMQVTSILDEILGTELAVNFGADTSRLSSSSNYRAAIPKIFGLDWLNPILGRGRKGSFSAEIDGSFIHSVDNFYAAEYIRYAYPGLFSFLFFIISAMKQMFTEAKKRKNGLLAALFIGSFCYFVNLWWLDSLQTLKYVYVLFAVCAVECGKKAEELPEKKSKYIISRR